MLCPDSHEGRGIEEIRGEFMSHQINDRIGLELGRRVAERLEAKPELIELAHANLENWSRRNVGGASLLRCYEEWRAILRQPLGEICQLLRSDTDEARRLRQNSPFAGLLSPREVWEIKRVLRQYEPISP